LLDVINVPPPAGLVAVAALPEQAADVPLLVIYPELLVNTEILAPEDTNELGLDAE
jgi:hypothetical protein